ncbi:MAG: polysaccharide deacetylase family protein, partial [Bacilli bacterium]|nr:polysaccharide deacetylase family protein [Bacilli bacterium]
EEIDIHDSSYDIQSNIVDNKLGDYAVVYNIKYKGREYKLTRRVSIVDLSAPTIEVNVETLEKDVCTDKYNKEITYAATDDFDGDITDKVIKEELTDKVILKVSDSSENVTTVEIPVKTIDKGGNRVLLNGSANMSVSLNGTYTERGAYLADGCDKKINEDIDISGSVDTSKEGVYTITYQSKTNKDLKATRKVSVYDMPSSIKAPYTGESVIYLTFDDGPCYYTKKILDVLDKYNIKATFFVTNQISGYKYMIAEEAKRGHTIGIHTLTHQWKIYHSLDSYWEDFNAMNDIVEQQTGKRATILRFPGGTSNQVAKTNMSLIASSVLSKGYQYYDWNVCVEDAGACVKSSNKQSCVYNYFTGGLQKGRDNIVLLHDLKSYTADSLEKMIKYGLDNGYTFKAIDENTATVHFKPYK